MSQIVCPDHDVDIDVTSGNIHGGQIVFVAECPLDGGHTVEVVEW